MSHIYKLQADAAERVRQVIAKPMPLVGDELSAAYERGEDPFEFGDCGAFDPWELFPSLYGTYSSDFDEMAIDVLKELRSGDKVRRDLGAEMFREMLCNAELCDYGTSPRVCFATTEFSEVLPALIERWEAFSRMHWGRAA